MKTMYWVIGVGLGALLLVGIVLDNSKSAQSAVVNSAPASRSASTAPLNPSPEGLDRSEVVKSYIRQQPPGYSLFSAQDVVTENYDRINGVSKQTITRLEDALRKYQSIPEVKELRDAYAGKMYVTFYTPENGGTSKILSKDKNQLSNYGNPNLLEICLYSPDYEQEPRMQGTLVHFDQEWRALIVPGMLISEPWFSAVHLHELYHAKRFGDHDPSATANPGSALYISEELDAHDLESKILEQATNWKYKAVLEKLVVARKDLQDPNTIIQTWTTEELKSLDGLFHNSSLPEASLRTAQYTLDLGSLWLAHRYQGDELKNRRTELYRALGSS